MSRNTPAPRSFGALITRLSDWDTQTTAHLRIAERPGLLRTVAAILAHSGDSWFCFLGLGLVWLYRHHTRVGNILRNQNNIFDISALASPEVYLVAAALVTALGVLIIKFTVRRRRPAGEWGNLYRRTDPHSFPSGHAVRAFMLAVFCIGLGYPLVGMLLMLWAPLVSLARVAMGVHYFSDVIAGATLGAILGIVYSILV